MLFVRESPVRHVVLRPWGSVRADGAQRHAVDLLLTCQHWTVGQLLPVRQVLQQR